MNCLLSAEFANVNGQSGQAVVVVAAQQQAMLVLEGCRDVEASLLKGQVLRTVPLVFMQFILLCLLYFLFSLPRKGVLLSEPSGQPWPCSFLSVSSYVGHAFGIASKSSQLNQGYLDFLCCFRELYSFVFLHLGLWSILGSSKQTALPALLSVWWSLLWILLPSMQSVESFVIVSRTSEETLTCPV